MTNPLDVERRLQSLLRLLQYPISPRRKFLEITRFLQELPEPISSYESHVVEACQAIPASVAGADFTGTDPSQLETALERLLAARVSIAALGEIEDFDRSLDDVREELAKQWRIVGEVERAARHAPPGGGTGRHRKPAAAAESRALVVLVPVVDRMLGWKDDAEFATLRQISIRFTSIAAGTKDLLHSDVTVMGDHAQGEEPHSVSVEAARRLLAARKGVKSVPFLEGTISFDQRWALHAGGSASLAVAAAAYCAFLQFLEQRELYRLRKDAAVSGNIDCSGAVLPVEEKGLALKIEATFFSPVKTLVVPKAQLPFAEACLAGLARRYPKRTLEIIGTAHLVEIFFNRKITDRLQVGLLRHLGGKARRHKISIALSVLLFVVCAYLLWRFGAPISPNPVAAEFAGDTMMLRNNLGQVVDRLRVGVTTAQRHREQAASGHTNALADIADVNGDEVNDVLYVQYGTSVYSDADTIVCYDPVKRRRLWAKALIDRIVFPGKPEVIDPRYRVVDMKVGGRSAGRVDYLVVAANHYVYFPALILTLDPLSGETLGRYIHTGQFSRIDVVDLEDDGDMELIGAGTNNAFKTATIVALSLDDLDGHSPTSVDYAPAGIDAAREHFYILVPRTLVGEAYRAFPGTSGAEDLIVQRAERRFEVSVQDVGSVDRKGTRVEAQLQYYFSFAGRPLAVGTSSSYDNLAAVLFEEGTIPLIPNNAYLEAHLERLRCWNGHDWSPCLPK